MALQEYSEDTPSATLCRRLQKALQKDGSSGEIIPAGGRRQLFLTKWTALLRAAETSAAPQWDWRKNPCLTMPESNAFFMVCPDDRSPEIRAGVAEESSAMLKCRLFCRFVFVSPVMPWFHLAVNFIKNCKTYLRMRIFPGISGHASRCCWLVRALFGCQPSAGLNSPAPSKAKKRSPYNTVFFAGDSNNIRE